jgi:hypothetical protein
MAPSILRAPTPFCNSFATAAQPLETLGSRLSIARRLRNHQYELLPGPCAYTVRNSSETLGGPATFAYDFASVSGRDGHHDYDFTVRFGDDIYLDALGAITMSLITVVKASIIWDRESITASISAKKNG